MNAAVVIADARFAPKSRRSGVFAMQLPCEDRPRPCAVVTPFGGRSLTGTSPETADQGADFADLLERVAARADKAAFTRLFAYYAPRVKGYLLRLGLGAAEAEEVCQEVMVAVWRKAASFDRRQASVATWIFRIARNRRIDAFRREQRAVLDVHDPAFQPAAEALPDSASESAEREAQLRRAMAELPPEQRDLVRVAFYEDLSHSQVAERTGLPLGTVKSRLRLAFAKLRLRLEADDEGDGYGGGAGR
jgi:RNA polymerase sigma-70 factor (ECF subfamily)